MGRRVVDTFAVERSTGRLVGYSQVQVGAGAELGYQQDTLVLREHRGHGLGLRMKAASTLAVLAEAPEVTRIRTWNADDNAPMLAVNRALGYEVDAWMRDWQKVVA
jgi:GNAT superfamily N-acetyltransferase